MAPDNDNNTSSQPNTPENTTPPAAPPPSTPENGASQPPASTSSAAVATGDDGAFEKGDLVTFDDQAAEVTFTYDDDTADVQLVDEKSGEVLRDENQQPRYFPNVPFAKLSHR